MQQAPNPAGQHHIFSSELDLPEVSFHIGLQKTGSTFLQEEVFRRITTDGFEYVDGHDHPDVFNSLRFQDPVYFDAERVRENILRLKPQARRLLISFEDLSGHPYNAAQPRTVILDKIKRCFPEAKIIFFIRRQDRFAVSSYLQTVRGGNSFSLKEYYATLFTGTFHTRFICPTLDFFLYRRYVDHICSTFGRENTYVIPYEKFIADNRNVINEMVSFLGINWAARELTARTNSRKGVVYTTLLRFENFFISRRITSNSRFFSGLPYYNMRKGKWRFITLRMVLDRLIAVGLFYDRPYRDNTGTVKRILALCTTDNRELDGEYGLGLKEFDYY